MKYILTAFTCLMFLNSAKGQKADSSQTVIKNIVSAVGLKVGENLEKMSGSQWDGNIMASIHVGGIFEITKKRFGLQFELMYKAVKFPFSSSSGNTYIKAEYCDFPILLEYHVISDLWVQAGVHFSGLIFAKGSSNMNPGRDKPEYKHYFNQMDCGPVLGCEFRLTPAIGAGTRYIHGLTNNNNNGITKISQNWQTQTIQVYLSYKFH